MSETTPSIVADIRVVAGNPSDEEVAAVTAVITRLAAEVEGTRRRRPQRATTAWEAVQRPIRTPIIPGVTRWRTFSG